MRTKLGRGTRSRLTLLAVAAMVFAGCAGSASAPTSERSGQDAANGGAGSAVDEAPAPAASNTPGAGGDTGSGSTADGQGLHIVYTGSLQLVVADVTAATAQAKAKVAAIGGYIGASEEFNKDDQPTAVITYRIPADKWDATIADLRTLATKVVAEQTSAAEVGNQLVDLEARIANLRASEAALQEIAKSTARVSDLLEVQAQLTEVRGQIEVLDAQRTHLVDQVSYGTLVTTYGLEVAAVKEVAKGWDPASEVDAATATLINAGQHLASGAIWFAIVWLPFLLVFGIVVFVGWRLIRRFGPKAPPPSAPIEGWTGTNDAPPSA